MVEAGVLKERWKTVQGTNPWHMASLAQFLPAISFKNS